MLVLMEDERKEKTRINWAFRKRSFKGKLPIKGQRSELEYQAYWSSGAWSDLRNQGKGDEL